MPLDFHPGEITRRNLQESFFLGVSVGLVCGVMAIAFFEFFTAGVM